jgi:arsenite-transporting ATPase
MSPETITRHDMDQTLEGGMSKDHLPFFLSSPDLRFLLFGGKGGVGKTTCAVAAALRFAHDYPEQVFLLVSTDPAHSLADSLADFPLPANLEMLEFDARACLADFKREHHEKFREIASRGTFLDDEDISRFLDLSLPGLDELMAFLEIAGWVEEGRYDRIVVDTAPTGHTLRLLAMPELIQKWLKALDALLAKHRYMKKLFTGAYQRDALDEFLLNLSQSVVRMRTLLTDTTRCCFIPVMLAETLSIRETQLLLAELKRLQIPVTDIVINRLYPSSTCPLCSDRHARQMATLAQAHEALTVYSLAGIPLYPQEIRGADVLDRFWDGIFPVKTRPSPVYGAPKQLPHKIEQPAGLPSPDTKLLLFAGKGGVGKTTLACATALRLARDLTNREVFLFSTDPAHSLSMCLDTPVGPEPTRLPRGLTAMAIDAQAEFNALKDQYTQELEEFLGSLSSNLDLTFDREVMERVLDLSPPGLDEVMALTLVMELLTEEKYHIFVLDSAPTGHLIRLLETPELIAQWLNVFFDLFLKYKRIFRLPRISARMVQMSKNLKLLRSLLKNEEASALMGVSILTEMAFQETQDLVAACRRMDVNIPQLFLNLVTPESPCRLCSEVRRQESQIRKKYAQTFGEIHQTLVYLQGEPRGLEALEALGDALYII